MKTFQGELPHETYHVHAKNPKKFQKFLAAYGCEATDFKGLDFYILCQGMYFYRDKKLSLTEPPVMTPKQFKKLVREAVGEPE